MDIATRVTPDTYGTRLDLKTQYDNFIDGKWQKPADGEYFDNLTPVTGQVLTRNARSRERDIELALDAAHRAAPKWGATSAAERARMLMRIADVMEANLERLAKAETWDNGKPIRETMAADLPLAIAQMSRHEEPALTANFHSHQADIPALDHASGAYHALERLAARVGAVELRAVAQRAAVLRRDERAFYDRLAFAEVHVLDLQFLVHVPPWLVETGRRFGR